MFGSKMSVEKNWKVKDVVIENLFFTLKTNTEIFQIYTEIFNISIYFSFKINFKNISEIFLFNIGYWILITVAPGAIFGYLYCY